MKALIVGGGSVGRFIAEQLGSTGHSVTILDNDPGVVKQYAALGVPGVTWVKGDGCELGALKTVGASE
ncbi:MAG: hypothetical protein JWM34_3536 [Ilumatobacteraceae bacterium]|nr:hypothetical protein [Ilumatobacteraceae bacterium]